MSVDGDVVVVGGDDDDDGVVAVVIVIIAIATAGVNGNVVVVGVVDVVKVTQFEKLFTK